MKPTIRARLAIHICISLVIGSGAVNAAAAINSADGGATSLRQAISDANAGDAINFPLPANSSVTRLRFSPH